MQKLTEKIWKLKPKHGLFNETVIINLFPYHSKSAIKGLVHRALENKEILLIKRGLYCLAKEYRSSDPHPFIIAHLIHGPSYISLESALWFHGLIPEALQQISCVTSQRSRNYKTPFGFFYYYRVPGHDLMSGVELVKLEASSWSYVAQPIRAIADLLYLQKEITWKKNGISFISENLRIELEDLSILSSDEFDAVIKSLKSHRIIYYLKKLKKELLS